MPPETPTTPRETTTDSTGGSSAGGWVRLGAIALSLLVIRFVAEWIVRGDQGPTTVLAPPDAQEQAAITTEAEPAPTTTADAAPTAPPARDEISLAILNGGDVAGLASLGYTRVETGNAPAQSGPTTVYHVAGQRPAAERVANDLEIGPIEALPQSGALATAAPDGARVVVVLGSG